MVIMLAFGAVVAQPLRFIPNDQTYFIGTPFGINNRPNIAPSQFNGLSGFNGIINNPAFPTIRDNITTGTTFNTAATNTNTGLGIGIGLGLGNTGLGIGVGLGNTGFAGNGISGSNVIGFNPNNSIVNSNGTSTLAGVTITNGTTSLGSSNFGFNGLGSNGIDGTIVTNDGTFINNRQPNNRDILPNGTPLDNERTGFASRPDVYISGDFSSARGRRFGYIDNAVAFNCFNSRCNKQKFNVCGRNGVTYLNSCELECFGIDLAHDGAC